MKQAETPGQQAPPDHLSDRAKAFWKTCVGAYELEPVHFELLLRALEAADRADQAGEILRLEGLTVAGRDGPKAHPAIQIELTNRRASTALLEKLRLDESPADTSRRSAGSALARARYKR